MDKQQIKIERERLKHQLRDELIEIGAKAIEHALRFLPEDNSIRNSVEAHLKLVRSKDRTRIDSAIRQFKTLGVYSVENNLLRATERLLKLTESEKWLAGNSVSASVFVPCWDAGSFVSQKETDDESDWQNKHLYAQIEQAFERLRDAEDQLRKQSRSLAA